VDANGAWQSGFIGAAVAITKLPLKKYTVANLQAQHRCPIILGTALYLCSQDSDYNGRKPGCPVPTGPSQDCWATVLCNQHAIITKEVGTPEVPDRGHWAG
jgi:hypothetical protein